MLKWYTLTAQTQRENTAAKNLEKRIKDKGMQEYFGEIIVPEEEVIQMNAKGERKSVKKRLFPGYILIQMNTDPKAVNLVTNTQYVSGIIGGASTPSPLTDEEANSMMKRKAEGFKATGQLLEVGDKVKVTEGPFNTFNGEVESVDKERVSVKISVFGRPTSVTMDKNQLAKVV